MNINYSSLQMLRAVSIFVWRKKKKPPWQYKVEHIRLFLYGKLDKLIIISDLVSEKGGRRQLSCISLILALEQDINLISRQITYSTNYDQTGVNLKQNRLTLLKYMYSKHPKSFDKLKYCIFYWLLIGFCLLVCVCELCETFIINVQIPGLNVLILSLRQHLEEEKIIESRRTY